MQQVSRPLLLSYCLLPISLLAFVACGESSSPATPATPAGSEKSSSSGLEVFLVPATFRARIQEPVSLKVSTPGAASSLEGADGEAYCAARLGGRQWILDTKADLQVVFQEPGRGAIVLSTPATNSVSGDPKRPARWRLRRHMKTLVTVTGMYDASPPPAPWLVGRFGLPLEIETLVDPVNLPLDSDLPVRVRFQGEGLADARIVLRRQDRSDDDDEVLRVTTNGDGFADLRIGGPGVWGLTTRHALERGEEGESVTEVHVASLLFEVSGEEGR